MNTRTPIKQLVESHDMFEDITPDKTHDSYVATILRNLFESVYEDPTWKGALDEKYNTRLNCIVAILTKPELAEACLSSMKSGDWVPVFAWLEEEKKASDLESEQPPSYKLTPDEYAWDVEFVGEAHKNLLLWMERTAKRREDLYSKVTPIIQSSGMGKSRTVDELAKLVFTIPICARKPNEAGYPYGDGPLWGFFQGLGERPYSARCLCMDLLCSIIQEIINNLKIQPINDAKDWYERLKQRGFRKKLYTDAVKNITESEYHASARNRLMETFAKLAQDLPTPTGSIRAIVYIDECYYLTQIDTSVDNQTFNALDEMRHAIECCGIYGLFGILLSTSSIYHSLSQYPEVFRSDRGDVPLLPSNARPVPFTALPFDKWNGNPIIKESQYTLIDICTLEFSSLFGRHLWWTLLMNLATKEEMLAKIVEYAARKLTINAANNRLSENGKIAALSARLALRLNPALCSLQDDLIANYMAVVYHVPTHKKYMYCGYPSEPILMEGAAFAWNRYFNPLEILERTFKSGFLAKGERSELVGRYICLRAQDIAIYDNGCTNRIGNEMIHGRGLPLLSFFKALFGPHWEKIRYSKARNLKGGALLEAACEDKYVRFTHFARAGDFSALSTAAGWKALARANAWQLLDNQEGISLGIPVFDGKPDHKLGRNTVTWILIQIKDSNRMRSVHFSAESLGIFEDRPKNDQTPYFVLAFQLSVKQLAALSSISATTAKLQTSGRSPPSSSQKIQDQELGGPKARRDLKLKRHPCYWIEVVGCSSNVFNPDIIPEDSTVLKEIVESSEILDEVEDEAQIGHVLELKPFFQSGLSSYDWAIDDRVGPTPGTSGRVEEPDLLEMVTAIEEVADEIVSDEDPTD